MTQPSHRHTFASEGGCLFNPRFNMENSGRIGFGCFAFPQHYGCDKNKGGEDRYGNRGSREREIQDRELNAQARRFARYHQASGGAKGGQHPAGERDIG